MVSVFEPRRLVREGAPVAAVLVFWVVLSWFGWESVVASAVRYAGVVMALFYAVTRGVELGRTVPAAGTQTPGPGDVRSVLYENARVALAAGAWFLAALAVYFVESAWDATGLPGAFVSPAADLSFALAGAGVGCVVVYAVAVGTARVRVGRERTGRGDVDGAGEAGDATPADD